MTIKAKNLAFAFWISILKKTNIHISKVGMVVA
jgi:hypothetical protein